MSLEQRVTELSNNVANLVHRVTTQADQWQQAVNQAQQQFQNFISNARLETPFIRISKNQALIKHPSENRPIDWIVQWETVELLEYIPVYDNNSNRTNWHERSLLELLTDNPNTAHISMSFNILHIVTKSTFTNWSWALQPTFGMSAKWESVVPVQPMSFMSLGKIITGSVRISHPSYSAPLLQEYPNSEWKLYGRVVTSLSSLKFTNFLFYLRPNTDIYIALPALVLGRFPYETYRWTYFVNIFNERR